MKPYQIKPRTLEIQSEVFTIRPLSVRQRRELLAQAKVHADAGEFEQWADLMTIGLASRVLCDEAGSACTEVEAREYLDSMPEDIASELLTSIQKMNRLYIGDGVETKKDESASSESGLTAS